MAMKANGSVNKTGAKQDLAPVLFISIDESKLSQDKPKPKPQKPAGIDDNELKIKKLNKIAAIEARISKQSVALAMRKIIDIEKMNLQRKIAFGKLARIFNGKVKGNQQFFMEEMFLAGADGEIDLDELLKSSQRNSIVSNESRLSLIFKNRASYAFNRNSSLGSGLVALQRSSKPRNDRHLKERMANSLWGNEYEESPWHTSNDQLGGSSVISEEIRLSNTLQNVEMKKEPKPTTIKSTLIPQHLSKLEQIFAKKSRKSEEKIDKFVQIDRGVAAFSSLLFRRRGRELAQAFSRLASNLQAVREQAAKSREKQRSITEPMVQQLVDASNSIIGRNVLDVTWSTFYCLWQMKMQTKLIEKVIGESGIEDSLDLRQKFLNSVAEESEEKAETLLSYLQEHVPNKFIVRVFVLDHLVSKVQKRAIEEFKFGALDAICELSNRKKSLERLLLTVDSVVGLRMQAPFLLVKGCWQKLSRRAAGFSILSFRADQLASEGLQFSFNRLLTRAQTKVRLLAGFESMQEVFSNKMLQHGYEFIDTLRLLQADSPLISQKDDRSGLPNRDECLETSANDPVYITEQFGNEEEAEEENPGSEDLTESVRCYLERLWRVSYCCKRASFLASLKNACLAVKLEVQDSTVSSLYRHIDQQNEEILKTKLYSIEKLIAPLISRQKYAGFFGVRAQTQPRPAARPPASANSEQLFRSVCSKLFSRKVREGFDQIQAHSQAADFQILKGEAMPSIYDNPSTANMSQFFGAKSAASISREPPRSELKPVEIDQTSTSKAARLTRSRLAGTPSEISENSTRHHPSKSKPLTGQYAPSEKLGCSKPSSAKAAFDMDPFELNAIVRNAILEKRTIFKRKSRDPQQAQPPAPAKQQALEIEEYLRKTAKFGSTARENLFLTKKPSFESSKLSINPQPASRQPLSKSGSLSVHTQNQKTQKKPTVSVFDDQDEHTPQKPSAITQWKLDKGYFNYTNPSSRSPHDHQFSLTYEERLGTQVRLMKPKHDSKHFEVDASTDRQNIISKSSYIESPAGKKQKKVACFGLAGVLDIDSSRRNKTEYLEGRTDRHRDRQLSASNHTGWSSSRTPCKPAH